MDGFGTKTSGKFLDSFSWPLAVKTMDGFGTKTSGKFLDSFSWPLAVKTMDGFGNLRFRANNHLKRKKPQQC
jgi:hypothetical protein